MNILFVHQNFPGQFRALAPALARQNHKVVALTLQPPMSETFGVNIRAYTLNRTATKDIHPWVANLEAKVIRGEACFRAARALRQEGFTPDLILAHPGWGESLFLKQVWPEAKLGIYCEMYYRLQNADADFDPEFSHIDEERLCLFQMKNANNLLNMDLADAGIAPTHWQASTYPQEFQKKIAVIHDGIDTTKVCPKPNVGFTLNNKLPLSRANEIITFVNRNLEPYRGYHIFMRSLPEILKSRPDAHILIVGADGIGYGTPAPDGYSWKEMFAQEVRHQISEDGWARVHFLGKLQYEQFIAVLQISTVHVYLTYPFVLSWSLLEAMSAGCVVVASDTSPVQEVITHNENGLLVPFFDIPSLARTICSALEDPALRSRLSAAAREHIVANYDLHSKCLPKQLKWVDTLLRQR